MISEEDINLKFVQFNTCLDHVVAVEISCPNCEFTVKNSVMNEGIREKKWCRNIDCDTQKFDVDEDRMTAFYLKHEVSKVDVEKKNAEGDNQE